MNPRFFRKHSDFCTMLRTFGIQGAFLHTYKLSDKFSSHHKVDKLARHKNLFDNLLSLKQRSDPF